MTADPPMGTRERVREEFELAKRMQGRFDVDSALLVVDAYVAARLEEAGPAAFRLHAHIAALNDRITALTTHALQGRDHPDRGDDPLFQAVLTAVRKVFWRTEPPAATASRRPGASGRPKLATTARPRLWLRKPT